MAIAKAKWFDNDAYVNNKLAQMKIIDPAYSLAALNSAFERAGYTGEEGHYRHFLDYGNAEDVSPSIYFDVEYYYQSKASHFYNVEFDDVTNDQIYLMKMAFKKAGLSAWDHYLKYGMQEGINPSENFDTNAYMQAKLAQMQSSDPDYTMGQLLEAFQKANLNPIEHYSQYGQNEGIVPQYVGANGSVQYLTTGEDNLVGKTEANIHTYGISDEFNDTFKAEVGTLQSEDTIDGLAGYDTLYARVAAVDGTAAGSLEPTVDNVETILFRSQIGDGTKPNEYAPVSAYIDADRISLVDGKNLTIGSDNSRASLSIEDVRHYSNQTTIRFADSDPADNDVDFKVYFDPQHLKADDATMSGYLNVELMDVFNADDIKDPKPLETNPYNEFIFYYTNGENQTTVDLKLLAKDEPLYTGDATYDNLVEAFNNALAELYPDLVGQLKIEKGDTFIAQAYSSSDGTLHEAEGNYVKISADNGTVTCPPDGVCGWKTDKTVPPNTNYDTRVRDSSDESCPLIKVNVELTNVGRVQWDDASECLPDDFIKGSHGGLLQIGSMSMRSGIERMDVLVDEGSWLKGLYSTNDTLRMVTVGADDINKDGIEGNKGQHRSQDAHMADDTVNGQLYIGTWEGKLDDKGDFSTNLTWADKARLLSADKEDNTGLNDVAVFVAEESYSGNINIAANITEASYDKYLKGVDGYPLDSNGIPVKNAPLEAYNGFFTYKTGTGNDTVNMTVDGSIAADVDFKMNINTSEGNDLVAFQYNDMSRNQQINNKYLQQVEINTETGDDTVWFYGAKVTQEILDYEQEVDQNGRIIRDQNGKIVYKTDEDGNRIPIYSTEIDSSMGGAVKVNAGQGADKVYVNQVDFMTGGAGSGVTWGPQAYNAVYVFNTYDRSTGMSQNGVVIDGFKGATLANDIQTGVESFIVEDVVNGANKMYAVVTFKGFTSKVVVRDYNYTLRDGSVDAGSKYVSAEQLNHAVIEAIDQSPVLKGVLVAKDGSGHSLIVESLINGEMTEDDLAIKFYIENSNGSISQLYTPKASGFPYDTTLYQSQFATWNSSEGAEFRGNDNNVTSQAIVDAGLSNQAGDDNDLIVLGKNGQDSLSYEYTVTYNTTDVIRDGGKLFVNLPDSVNEGKEITYVSFYHADAADDNWTPFYRLDESHGYDVTEDDVDKKHTIEEKDLSVVQGYDQTTGKVVFGSSYNDIKIASAYSDLIPGEIADPTITQPTAEVYTKVLGFDFREVKDGSVLTLTIDGTEKYTGTYSADQNDWIWDKPVPGYESPTENLKLSEVRISRGNDFKLEGTYDQAGDGNSVPGIPLDPTTLYNGNVDFGTLENPVDGNLLVVNVDGGKWVSRYKTPEDSIQSLSEESEDASEEESDPTVGWSQFKCVTNPNHEVFVSLDSENGNAYARVSSYTSVTIDNADSYLGSTGYYNNTEIGSATLVDNGDTYNTGMDIVELNGSFGNDALFDFQTGEDKINVHGLGLTANPIIDVAPNALSANTAYVGLAPNLPSSGAVYSQNDVDKLVSDGFIKFTGTNGTAVVFLDDGVKDIDNNVYTVVKVTANLHTVMGSLTLANGEQITDANTDLIGVESNLLNDDELASA